MQAIGAPGEGTRQEGSQTSQGISDLIIAPIRDQTPAHQHLTLTLTQQLVKWTAQFGPGWRCPVHCDGEPDACCPGVTGLRYPRIS